MPIDFCYMAWLRICPVNGGNCEDVTEENFLCWTPVRVDGKLQEGLRESYGGNIWKEVARAEQKEDLGPMPKDTAPVAPAPLPLPKIPAALASKEVDIAPTPRLPELQEAELDPAGSPIATGKTKKAKA